MVKIISYSETKRIYSRPASDQDVNKDLSKSGRIYAEDELDKYVNEGWTIISASTAEVVQMVLGSSSSFTRLTVILKK